MDIVKNSIKTDEAILNVKDLIIKKGTVKDYVYEKINFELLPKTMLLLKIDSDEMIKSFADILLGLDTPLKGEVFFNGHLWKTLSHDNAHYNRSLIRRVFKDCGWVSNLTIMENIIIRELHHTNRKETDIIKEVMELAQKFEVEGMFDLRPHLCSKDDLKVLQWIRALIGSFQLIVLEEPFINGESKNQLLFDHLNEKTQEGAAVLWLIHTRYGYEILQGKQIKTIYLN